ncbi:molybdenum ABC transporter ATP-binding protein [Nitrococcus mobilis]|uniref:Molybdenum import ATP-binding protein n=1 Tax=Nitrococcus mobilis Nb-231 TaxID=314278 RepID=A4BVS1_9GAMM|nr:molybdenum ABC transporter ATP-binding protein [Nitrococcus mobilis]EAR20193.1 molybdenum import ATP-binding protein [Nitrococcus mobilis Nb-231]
MSLEARFWHSRGRFVLDAQLQAPTRAVTVLFGHSGCGKSTLLHCLAGLERAAGRCRLNGTWWQHDERKLFVPTHKRRLGLVFQDARLFEHLSVAANLRYATRRSRAGAAEWNTVVELLGLGPLLRQTAPTLSGGERQRVAIARSLLARPEVLLLDEPLASLDAASKAAILPYLERLTAELAMPMVYVTHSADELVRLGNQVILMEAGRTLEAGPLETMLSRLDLPLAHREDASAVIAAQVQGWDEALHLSILRLGALQLRVPQIRPRVGQPVRLRVRARDVSLTLDPPGRTSILNVLPAQVLETAADSPGQHLVRLRIEDQILLSRISELSQRHLCLQPGMAVFAQVKSVALV